MIVILKSGRTAIIPKCNIDGIVIRALEKHTDARGWLIELFRSDECADDFRPAMSYISMTLPGVVRGPHEHRKQTDYFCFFGLSSFRIFLWDNRSDSPTFGNKFVFEAGEGNMVSFIVPPGVVHAYKNIGEVEGLVFNAPDRLYRGPGRVEEPDEIRYEENIGSRFHLDD